MRSCKKCGYKHSYVTDTRIENGSPVRRRTCLNCGFKWKTIEILYYEYFS